MHVASQAFQTSLEDLIRLPGAFQAKIMFETVAHCSLMNIESARSCVPAAQNEPKNARNPGLSESSRQTATYSFISCSNVQ
jgi:hypothetical protein